MIGALLDVDLGDGGSGLDLARALRARDPALPIAFITASTDAAQRPELAQRSRGR